MATYLLTWNPNRWLWPEEEIRANIAQLRELGPEEFARVNEITSRWSIGTNYRRIQPGDRLFLTRVVEEPRGIFASGYVASEPFEGPHWDEVEGHTARYVNVYWDTLLNPYDPRFMLLREELDFISTDQRWSPLSSGEEIRDEVAAKLEIEWQRLTGNDHLWEDVDDDVTMPEGAVRQTSVTK